MDTSVIYCGDNVEAMHRCIPDNSAGAKNQDGLEIKLKTVEEILRET